MEIIKYECVLKRSGVVERSHLDTHGLPNHYEMIKRTQGCDGWRMTRGGEESYCTMCPARRKVVVGNLPIEAIVEKVCQSPTRDLHEKAKAIEGCCGTTPCQNCTEPDKRRASALVELADMTRRVAAKLRLGSLII